MTAPLKKAAPSLYDQDFFAWTLDQAEKLRARAAFDHRGDLDWDNLAEEIESVGRSDRREIRTRMGVLLQNLLKWQVQPARRGDSWRQTIAEQRLHIGEVLADSPSLSGVPAAALDWAYGWAVREAARETGLPLTHFPALCPYTISALLDPEFLPEAE